MFNDCINTYDACRSPVRELINEGSAVRVPTHLRPRPAQHIYPPVQPYFGSVGHIANSVDLACSKYDHGITRNKQSPSINQCVY